MISDRQITIRSCDNGFVVFPVHGGKNYIANNYEELNEKVRTIFEALEEKKQDVKSPLQKGDLN